MVNIAYNICIILHYSNSAIPKNNPKKQILSPNNENVTTKGSSTYYTRVTATIESRNTNSIDPEEWATWPVHFSWQANKQASVLERRRNSKRRSSSDGFDARTANREQVKKEKREKERERKRGRKRRIEEGIRDTEASTRINSSDVSRVDFILTRVGFANVARVPLKLRMNVVRLWVWSTIDGTGLILQIKGTEFQWIRFHRYSLFLNCVYGFMVLDRNFSLKYAIFKTNCGIYVVHGYGNEYW